MNRLIIIYKEKGKSGFVHGNRSKKPIRTLDKTISENIILLYKNKYQDSNFKHNNFQNKTSIIVNTYKMHKYSNYNSKKQILYYSYISMHW